VRRYRPDLAKRKDIREWLRLSRQDIKEYLGRYNPGGVVMSVKWGTPAFRRMRSVVARRVWAKRKRKGGKGTCFWCKKPVYTDGVHRQGHFFHKTHYETWKRGFKPEQFKNPRKGRAVRNLRESRCACCGKVWEGAECRCSNDWCYKCKSCLKHCECRLAKKSDARNPGPIKHRQSKFLGRIYINRRDPKLFSRGHGPPPLGFRYASLYEIRELQKKGVLPPYHNPLAIGYHDWSVNPGARSRPPAAWFAKMKARVRAEYPDRSDADINRIVAGIWWGYSDATRRRIGRKYERMAANPLAIGYHDWSANPLAIGKHDWSTNPYFRDMSPAEQRACLKELKRAWKHPEEFISEESASMRPRHAKLSRQLMLKHALEYKRLRSSGANPVTAHPNWVFDWGSGGFRWANPFRKSTRRRCPNPLCGNPILFEPGVIGGKCPHCGVEVAVVK
jgi:hypothetical protein